MKRYEHLGPGLHRIGPEPYAFVYNPARGQRLTFIDINGEQFTGEVSDFTEIDGVITLEIQ